jgi:aldose 1-epimerase
MSEIVLSAGRLRATILPHVGAGIADFSVQGPSGFFYPIMRRAAHGEMNASLLSSFIMAPWVNRIGGAKFTWGGKEYKIRPTTADGMAQHGDVRKRPWHVVTDTATAAIVDFNSETFRDSNWPWRSRRVLDRSLAHQLAQRTIPRRCRTPPLLHAQALE